MLRLFALSGLVAGLLVMPVPVAAEDPPAKPKPGTTEHILAALRQPVKFQKNLRETALSDILHDLSRSMNVPFIIMEEQFRAAEMANIREQKPNLTVDEPSAVTLRRFLDLVLGNLPPQGATYLVRKDHIAIVPLGVAARTTGGKLEPSEGELVRLKEPLVSAIYKEKPMNEVVADLAEEYDLNVVITPQAGDNRTAFVNVRLLNVPAGKALELIAVQAELRVVHDGNTYLITSADHAHSLFDERMEKQQRIIELKRLRDMPAFPQLPMSPFAPK